MDDRADEETRQKGHEHEKQKTLEVPDVFVVSLFYLLQLSVEFSSD